MDIEKELELDFEDFAQEVGAAGGRAAPDTQLPKNEVGSGSVLADPLLLELASNRHGATVGDNPQKDLQRFFALMGNISGELTTAKQRLFEDMTHLFGELADLVPVPDKHARVLEQLLADQKSAAAGPMLDNQTAMAVAVAFSRSPLNAILSGTDHAAIDSVRTRLLPQIETINALTESKSVVLNAVSQRILRLAPNINQVVGPFLTAVLIGRAGGLAELARIPACNLLALAGRSERQFGLAGNNKAARIGEFGSLPMVVEADEEDRPRLAKLLSNAVAKVARIDSAGLQKEGQIGRDMLKDLLEKFEKSRQPKSGQMRKPLPIPDDAPKKRRGGRKFRRAKEKLALTEARMAKNRIKFGAAFDESVGINANELGMLAQMGAGKLKIQKKQQKLGLTKKQQERLEKDRQRREGKQGVDFAGPEGISIALQAKREGK